MTRPVVVTAATVAILSASLIVAILALTTSSDAADTNQSGPAGGTGPDFKVQAVTVSYRDTANPTSNPITSAGVNEEFRVRVDFAFHNNGPVGDEGTMTVTLLGPPDGCEFVLPVSGVDQFDTGITVEFSTTIEAFAELKVKCTTPGEKLWSATVRADPKNLTDSDPSNNELGNGADDPITITSGSPTPTATPLPSTVEDTPTPTPTATPTATPGPSGGETGGPPITGGPPVPPTPTPTYFTQTPPPTYPFQDPFFSVRANGPSGLDPADILRAPGSVTVIECLEMGLDCDGVDGQGAPIQDDIDALTFANEHQGGQIVFFSTDSGSAGIEGSGTHSQSNVNQQCHEEGNEYAEFPIGVGGDNRMFYEATALGLQESTCPDAPDDDDDMNALSWGSFDPHQDDPFIYFSLAPNSPTLTDLGASPADILVTQIEGDPAIYRSAASLGLTAQDDIDGVCLFRENNDDRFLISLSRGSPTLALIGATPDDVLFPGGFGFPPNRFKDNTQFGLLGTDNIDAMKCQEPEPPRGPQGDFNCDGQITAADALLLTRYLAGIGTDIPDCPDIGEGPADALIGDLNCDGQITTADLLLVLQAAGSLRPTLPVGCPPIGPSYSP